MLLTFKHFIHDIPTLVKTLHIKNGSHSYYAWCDQTFYETSPVWAGNWCHPSTQEVDTHKAYLLRDLLWLSATQASVVPPAYLAFAAINFRIVLLHSSPVQFCCCLIRSPEVSVNNTHYITCICNRHGQKSDPFDSDRWFE